MSRILITTLILALLLQSCSAVEGLLPMEPDSVDIVTTEPRKPEYVAPTLPPEYTSTPTVTRTPTSPPSPTPFQVVTIEATEEPEAKASPSATPVVFVGQWERYESTRLGAAIQVPPQLSVRDFGQSILIGNASLSENTIPLFMEIRFDQAGSYRLPEGIDATNPRNVLEAVVRELEETYTEVQLVRSIDDVTFNGINASEVAARVSLITSTAESNLNWYLAVAIQDKRVVRFYASSPASAGVTYMTVAERIADTFQMID
jgi:hypothetical protein